MARLLVTPSDTALTIVYIVGVQNCGSTLLDAVLGAAPGAYGLGEAAGFFRALDNAPCQCGEVRAACGPCHAALDAATATESAEAFRDVARRPMGGRCLHWTVVPTARRRRYAADADRILEAVAGVTGATTLIDSSKNVGRLGALLASSRHDIRVIHLVRDPRGYIQSRQRRADAVGKEKTAVTFGKWLSKNLVINALVRPRARGRFTLCRYEDLLLDPAATLARIGTNTGLDVDGLALRATGDGVERHHLYEPGRRVDYSTVRLDSSRLAPQRYPKAKARRFWWAGGFASRLWGYDRDQRYLAP